MRDGDDRYGYLILTDANHNLVMRWHIADNFGDVRYRPGDGQSEEGRARGARKIRAQNAIMGEISKLIDAAHLGEQRALQRQKTRYRGRS